MNKSEDMSMQDSLEHILLLKKREQSSYKYSKFYRPRPETLNAKFQMENLSIKDDSNGSRTKICGWTFNVIDHFDLSRETALISLDIFDRFLATHGGQASPQLALLTAITAIYISIKVHSQVTLNPDCLSSLSRDQFTASDIELMEVEILKGIQWLVHPPTPISFLPLLISCLPECMCTTRRVILEQAQYLAELSAFDPLFIDYQSSTIAFASLLSAIDLEVYFGQISSHSRETFLAILDEHADMSINSIQVTNATERMKQIIIKQQQDGNKNFTSTRERDVASPTSAICKHFSEN